MTEDEQKIDGIQKHLDRIAAEIDLTIEADDDDTNAMFYRLLHAQGTALLYLMKKGQTDLEFRNIE